MAFPPNPDSSRAGGEAFHVSPSHASALLRSAMAISSELIGASFPAMVRGLVGQAGSKADSDAGALQVQRHLAARAAELQRAFLERLQEAQDQYLTDLTASRRAGSSLALDAETLSLVDAVSVESSTVVDRHANKVAGLIEQPVSDLNVVVGALLGRPFLADLREPPGPFGVRAGADERGRGHRARQGGVRKLPGAVREAAGRRTGQRRSTTARALRAGTGSTCARFAVRWRFRGPAGAPRRSAATRRWAATR